MSHHYSGPDFGFPRGDARLDLTDLYAFPKPGDPRKSIIDVKLVPLNAYDELAADHVVEPTSSLEVAA